MRTFLRRSPILLSLIVTISIWLAVFPQWANWVTSPPLDEPISLSPAGSVDKQISVVVPERYELVLSFSRSTMSFDQLRTLLGDWAYRDGKPIPSGIHVPVSWSIADSATGAVVDSGQVDTFGSFAWSATYVDRMVDHLHVPAGKYRFSAKIMGDVPEFARVPTRLTIQLPAKASSTWQVGFVWMGGLLNYLVLGPLLIGCVVVLLWRLAIAMTSPARP